MSDELLRDLERQAKAGDVGAAARLVMENQKLFGFMCNHWLTSRRLWVGPGGKQRYDRFCLYCGMNLDLIQTPGVKPVVFNDCDTSRRILHGQEQERLAALAEEEAARRARDEAFEIREIARLRAEHEWLHDVPDEDVIDVYSATIDIPEMPW